MSETSPMVDPNQIITGVVTELAQNVVVSFWDKVKRFFKDLDADEQIRYGEAYEIYLEKTRKKHSQIKTLIYRKVPKDLESFYECTYVQCNRKIIDTSNVTNLLDLGNKIVVTGTGGIGKSMLLKYLFLNTIKRTNCIPVLFELRGLNSIENGKIDLFSCIYSLLVENGFVLQKKYFKKSMQEGGYVILFDGFDELNREKADIIGREIKRLADHYNKNHFVISSRPMDAFIGWNEFCEVSVCPLTKKQAINLIQRIEYDESVKEKFLVALKEGLYNKYKSFASNPLLLTIMLMTFSNHASIPDRLNDFYEQAFATLYNMHDATKGCYTRDICTGLGCEEFKIIFSYICFKTYFKSEYEFSDHQIREYIQQAKQKFKSINFTVEDYKRDLILSVCMLVKDGITYRFAHRSFQEYFAAWYTCKLMDKDQKKVLTAWMEESLSACVDEYLTMLFNMQPDKVNELILCPGIKKIKKVYDSTGFSIDFVKTIHSSILFRKDIKNDIKYTFTISDNYIYNIVRITSSLNGYRSIYKIDEELRNKINHNIKLLNALKEDRKVVRYSLQDALNIVAETDLLKMFGWLQNEILFCFSILDKYSNNKVDGKRTLDSIVDEL